MESVSTKTISHYNNASSTNQIFQEKIPFEANKINFLVNRVYLNELIESKKFYDKLSGASCKKIDHKLPYVTLTLLDPLGQN